jgi:hypothetical protein
LPDYRVLIVDAMTGDVKATDIPFTFSGPFTQLMNDVGTCSGTFPADHPKATHDIVEDGLREITILRDDVPVWNGPFKWSVDSVNRLVQIDAVEASAYFDLRVREADHSYNEDRFDWVRDEWTYMTSKTSTAGDGTGSAGTDINATIPNFAVSSGTSGFNLNSSLAGVGFYTFRDILDKLAENPDEGIEWCVDYTTGSTRQLCQRTLTLGAPLGSVLTRQLFGVALYSYGRSGDPLSGGTRIHVRGSGITSTKQNTGSLTDWPLIEKAVDRGDITDQTILDDAAREIRRQAQPPVKVRTASWIAGRALPWGFCKLGDTVPFQVDDPAELLEITAPNLRVVGLSTQPPTDGAAETVTPIFDQPLSDTGA